jgi:hypothetical protein
MGHCKSWSPTKFSTRPLTFPHINDLPITINDVFTNLNKRFKAKKLELNFYDISYIKFATKNMTCLSFKTGLDNKLIEEVGTNQLLGLQIINSMNQKKHIGYIIHKLSSACFAIRTVTPLMTTDTLKLVYFHSIVTYGLIVWGNSIDRNKVFNIQKKIIRIPTGVKSRVSCRTLFWKFNILPFASKYTFY